MKSCYDEKIFPINFLARLPQFGNILHLIQVRYGYTSNILSITDRIEGNGNSCVRLLKLLGLQRNSVIYKKGTVPTNQLKKQKESLSYRRQAN